MVSSKQSGNSNKSLKQLSCDSLITWTLCHTLPQNWPHKYEKCVHRAHILGQWNIDAVILADEDHDSTPKEIIDTKLWLLDLLRTLKEWWISHQGPGGIPAALHKVLRVNFLKKITSQIALSPVYKVLLKILFAGQAEGHYPWVLANRCPILVQDLDYLGPFVLDEIDDRGLVFQDHRPLVSLVQQNKGLHVLRLHHVQYDHSEELLTTIRKHCRYLSVIAMDCHMIPEALLFSTFFNGMTQEMVLKLLGGEADSTCFKEMGKEVVVKVNDGEGDIKLELSFPELQVLELPHLRYDSKFISVMKYIQPSLKFTDRIYS